MLAWRSACQGQTKLLAAPLCLLFPQLTSQVQCWHLRVCNGARCWTRRTLVVKGVRCRRRPATQARGAGQAAKGAVVLAVPTLPAPAAVVAVSALAVGPRGRQQAVEWLRQRRSLCPHGGTRRCRHYHCSKSCLQAALHLRLSARLPAVLLRSRRAPPLLVLAELQSRRSRHPSSVASNWCAAKDRRPPDAAFRRFPAGVAIVMLLRPHHSQDGLPRLQLQQPRRVAVRRTAARRKQMHPSHQGGWERRLLAVPPLQRYHPQRQWPRTPPPLEARHLRHSRSRSSDPGALRGRLADHCQWEASLRPPAHGHLQAGARPRRQRRSPGALGSGVAHRALATQPVPRVHCQRPGRGQRPNGVRRPLASALQGAVRRQLEGRPLGDGEVGLAERPAHKQRQREQSSHGRVARATMRL